MSATATPAPTVLATGQTNPNGPTVVQAQVRAPDGLLFFDPASNQLVEVPRASVVAVTNEVNEMRARCNELHLAREEIVSLEGQLEALASQRFPSLGQSEALKQQLLQAQARYNKAYEWVRAELGDQGYLTGASNGRELMELIPLAQRDRPGAAAQPLGKKWTYVRSEKMRNHWRGYKLGAGDKGQNISFIKNGQIDSKALKEQFTKIEPKLKADWGLAAGYLFPQLQSWAEALRVPEGQARIFGKKEDDLLPGESQLSVDFKSEAHLFRYFVGCGAEGSWAPLEGKIAGKLNGKAELQIARAEAAIECIYPRASGWAWSLPGVKTGKTFHIGAIRLLANLKVGAGAGASLSAELALELDYSAALPGKGPAVKGRRRKAQTEAQPRGVKLGETEANVSAGAEAFAGAKASGEFMGGLQFLNPEKGDKWDYIAAVGPKVEGQAGAGAAASLFITFDDGKFKLRAKAGLCLGLGAKGELGLEVNARRMASFLEYLFHALLNANFEMLEVIGTEAYEEACRIQVLLVQGANKIVDAIEQRVTSGIGDVQRAWEAFETKMEREADRVALMERVLENPAALRTCTPEAHGMLLYQLTRHGVLTKAIPQNTGLNLELLYRRKQAVLQVCRWAQTKRQFENIVQHISPVGAKGGFKGNLDGLKRFMEIGPGDSQMDETLQALYDRLPQEPARGYAVAMNHTSEFLAQARVGSSPLYVAMLGGALPLPDNIA